MQITKIPFSRVPQLSNNDRSYAERHPALRPFYKYAPEIESFEQVIEDKQKDNTNRKLLVEVLKEQYSRLEISPELDSNIKSLLSSNTFTVITAHQPSLFTGPLYYVFKIITTLNLAKQLNNAYPENRIIPVFVTGGEDHDFEEANHANIFGKRLEWQSGETGSVGAMSTEKLAPVLEELKGILGTDERAVSVFQKIEKAYTGNKLYSAATVELVNSLFGEYGLVVLNMNNAKLKQEFIPYLKKELFERPSQQLVETTSQQLVEAGFKAQATPREINLFYLRDQIRERIVWEEGKFKVLNTAYKFSEKEMEMELNKHPEYFSPNVVIRPLYQEVIFPNLAYVGGGGELAYWLERKTQFEHFGVNFPVLMRRNSGMWLDRGLAKKRLKLGYTTEELFDGTDALIKLFVQRNAAEEINFSKEKESLTAIFEVYRQKAKGIDPTLVKAISAEEAKQLKVLDQLAGRLLRAEKQKHEVSINQLKGLKEKLFPGNGLQERKDNFLSFYIKYGDQFFESLIDAFDPFDPSFVILEG